MRQNIASLLIFRRGDTVAFIKRQNTGWMDGKYALPGGKVDPGESFTHAAIREAQEEVGIELTAAQLEPVYVGHMRDDEIWVNVVFEAHDWTGKLINAEPHASSELAWLDVSNLPVHVAPNSRFYLEQVAAGRHYGERGWPNN